jgi:predicted dehydrogenase
MARGRKITRRRMLRQATGTALAGIVPPLFASCAKSREGKEPQQPNSEQEGARTPTAIDEVGVGIIGCGRRNGQLVMGKGGQGKLPDYARIVAVADLNQKRAGQWADKYQCPAFDDYRSLLDRQDVDVVIYATPEHWHYLPCIHACQAGKDIYGEQPLSHTIREGRVMVEAVRKYGRVFQTGEQQRSHPLTRKAVELILNGRIGKVRKVIGYNYPSPFECDFPPQPTPGWLDWDRWCGPNEVVPYHTDLYLSRIPYVREKYPAEPAEKYAVGPGWMSFRPYSGGELANWGCHGLSMVQWALGMDRTGPVDIWVEPEQRLQEVWYHHPETRDRGDNICSSPIIYYRYANGIELVLSDSDPRLGGGATFVGELGKITIFREGYECDPEGLDDDPLPPDAIRVYRNDHHMGNFFRCVRSRTDPIMDVESAHRVATLCHLGNIARWVGRPIKWDPAREQVPGDDAANHYLDCPNRQGFACPESV